MQGEVQGLRIYLLGGFRVMVGQRAIAEKEWRLRKARSLFKLLALAPHHRSHREQIIDLLWPELDAEAALNNLHRVVHAIRHVLEPALDPHRPSAYLRFQENVLALSPSLSLWIDVEQFEEARRAIHEIQEPAAYRSTLALYAGDLLPEDRYEDWAVSRREQLRQSYVALLTDLARLYEKRNEDDAAIETLQRLVVEEPTLEEAQLKLMRLYAETGQRYQALRQFQQLRDALRRELDTEPAMTVQHLYRDIQAGRFVPERKRLPTRPVISTTAMLAVYPREEQVNSPTTGKTSLPHALTSFVGRGQEMSEIGRLLMQTRLVALIGAGGSGKTRLAIQTAAALSETFADGVRLVEFAALTDSSLVTQATAAALDVHETADSSLLESLIEALRSKRLLLLLDNCEHLVDACARLADTLLQSCPHLRILATSRQTLGLIGETVWRVPALAVPDPERLPLFEHLSRYDTVRLFYERACASRPDFALTPENAAAVVQICRRLDGLPLAIELSAVRVKVLSVEQIAERLDDALALLVTGSRTALRRQRTLRATYDWSYALLSERERALFRRLSVFAGGWTLEAAEQVCARPDLLALSSAEMSDEQEESATVFDLLAQLVDKSLVVMTERGGQSRYSLLETLRQYGVEQLAASGEMLTVRHQHLEWCLALAEAAETELTGPDQAVWIERLEAEHDNLRAVLSWANKSGASDDGLRLVGALWLFWSQCSYLSEGRRWLEEMLAVDGGMQGGGNERRLAASAKALRGAGILAYQQADFERATFLAGASLVCYRELGDSRGMARALNNQGIVALKQGDYARAEALCQEALVLASEAGNEPLSAIFLNNLGVIAGDQGDYTRAIALYEESLAQYRKLGDNEGIARAFANLGEMALGQGDYLRAAVLYHDGLALAQKIGSKELIAYGLEGAAGAASAQGSASAALHAARLWGTAQVLRAALHAPLPPVDAATYERLVAAARDRCDAVAFTRAWDEGQAMPLEDAIAAALTADIPAVALSSTTSASIPQELLPADPSLPLTQREREVAALIAIGCANRAIAAKLAISERTVENHVAKILAKLALTSRAQIAVWAVKRLPLPEK